MKIVKRIGVFETNSSSTHTLTLVSKSDYEVDKQKEKPKYRKYGVVATKYDKLLMACGCCKELFDDSSDYSDESARITAYKAAISLFVRVYCELTYDDYDKTFAKIIKTNDSGRACHMKFFREGALYDSECDYMLIDDMLLYECLPIVLDNIRHYFDDDVLLLYREYYSGVGMYDDDDDE